MRPLTCRYTADRIGNACGWSVEQLTGEKMPPAKPVQRLQRDGFLSPDSPGGERWGAHPPVGRDEQARQAGRGDDRADLRARHGRVTVTLGGFGVRLPARSTATSWIAVGPGPTASKGTTSLR